VSPTSAHADGPFFIFVGGVQSLHEGFADVGNAVRHPCRGHVMRSRYRQRAARRIVACIA